MELTYREMGLNDEEYGKIVSLLGRKPNFTETGIFAVMWSEHCGYKHSRALLRFFPTHGPQVIEGPGENAGVVDIGDDLAVVFKMESHNHPSAIEPFQGAATGIGGIVRDILAMGARPIALLDSLRFGLLDSAFSRYIFSGVVSGISSYGNCLGIPTIGGETVFDPSYNQNPLVNVMCVGLVQKEKLVKSRAPLESGSLMLVGARTGRDGIHGATFASEELSEASVARRPAVQVGDPFMEKLLIEACLEAIENGCILGLQDLGAAGITSAAVEMASRSKRGVEVDVDKVLRREENMLAYEILLSESQERMLLVPLPGKEEKLKEIFKRWDLEASIIGKITTDNVFRVKEKGQIVAEVPIPLLTDECPIYYPPANPLDYWKNLKEPCTVLPPKNYNESLLELLKDPNCGSKRWIYEQYDYEVQTNTVISPSQDAAVLRIKDTNKALAVTTDGNSRYVYIDPYWGGAIAVAEACRNLIVRGARPLAVTDCLNFGNPEKPEVFWQMEEAIKGMSMACDILKTPVVSGNVSLYNESEEKAIFPTPVIGMVGIIDDLNKIILPAWQKIENFIFMVGPWEAQLGGSFYLFRFLGKQRGPLPLLDLKIHQKLTEFMLEGKKSDLFLSAHDISEGGLAVALSECSLTKFIGASIKIPAGRPDYLLFSEGQGRILLEVLPHKEKEIRQLAENYSLPLFFLGKTGGERLIIKQEEKVIIDLGIEELDNAYEEAIPSWMNV